MTLTWGGSEAPPPGDDSPTLSLHVMHEIA